jgi:hypothetical protein
MGSWGPTEDRQVNIALCECEALLAATVPPILVHQPRRCLHVLLELSTQHSTSRPLPIKFNLAVTMGRETLQSSLATNTALASTAGLYTLNNNPA